MNMIASKDRRKISDSNGNMSGNTTSSESNGHHKQEQQQKDTSSMLPPPSRISPAFQSPLPPKPKPKSTISKTNGNAAAAAAAAATTTDDLATASRTTTTTSREQAIAEANEVLNTASYKRGRFENFNLLGVVTSPRGMMELSRHGSSSSVQGGGNSSSNLTNATASSSSSGMNQISNNFNTNAPQPATPSSFSPSPLPSLFSSNTYTTPTPTTAASPSSFGGLMESYVDPNLLSNISNISESITKEIESLNSTIYSYSRNYLGQYPSLSSTVGAMGGGGGDFMSTLDFENELIHSMMMEDGGGGSGSNSSNGGAYFNGIRTVEELPPQLVNLDLTSVEGYLRRCGLLAHAFDKQMRQSEGRIGIGESKVIQKGGNKLNGAGTEADVNDDGGAGDGEVRPEEEEEEADPTAMIPEIFFSPFFDLTDPKTFESLLVLNDDDDEGDNGDGRSDVTVEKKQKKSSSKKLKTPVSDNDPIIRIPKPEKLTQYLDTVELSLLNQVRSKSDSFFQETNRFSYLKSLVADLVEEVTSLRGQLEQIRERSITEVELIPVMDRRRKDIKVLGQVLDEIMDVVEVKGSVAGLIASGDFLGAVEAIHSAKNLLNGSRSTKDDSSTPSGRYMLGKVVALNKVNDQLDQYENLVVMDLSNDVVELFLSWNDGSANAEMRVKVKNTILALKKCKKLSTMADIYRENLCETIRVTIRTTVAECAVDAAKDFKKPLVPSATIVSIPSKDGDESNKTSITEGVTSMTFEQFMDCLDMIFEQSLSLLKSAAKVNKFCLEEGISLKEDESSRDVSALSAASDLSHKSISEILRLRKDAHSLITFEDMRRLWDSCLAFTLQVEKVSGQKAYGLRSTLLAQAKAFVERKHEANMSSLVAALDGERWNQCDVSSERQAALERLCTGRAVLSSTRDKGSSQGTDVAEASSIALVEGTRYRVVWSCLLLIEHIMSNVACAAHFQTLATNVVGKVSELFRLFNARATQLVLGAGAIHSAARLKSINAKHLALVTQCVGIVLAILPHVRAALMAQLPSKQHALLVDLDKIKKEYAEHHDKVLSKFVGIIGGIVEHNLVSRIANTDFDERSKLPKNEEMTKNVCCPFLEGIMTNTRKMHQVLVSLLPSDDLMDVFSRIFSYLDSKVPKILIEANLDEQISFGFPTSLEGKRRVVYEVEVMSKTLNKLPNVRAWDFGAMKFLERKLELPSSLEDNEVGSGNVDEGKGEEGNGEIPNEEALSEKPDASNETKSEDGIEQSQNAVSGQESDGEAAIEDVVSAQESDENNEPDIVQNLGESSTDENKEDVSKTNGVHEENEANEKTETSAAATNSVDSAASADQTEGMNQIDKVSSSFGDKDRPGTKSTPTASPSPPAIRTS